MTRLCLELSHLREHKFHNKNPLCSSNTNIKSAFHFSSAAPNLIIKEPPS